MTEEQAKRIAAEEGIEPIYSATKQARFKGGCTAATSQHVGLQREYSKAPLAAPTPSCPIRIAAPTQGSAVHAACAQVSEGKEACTER